MSTRSAEVRGLAPNVFAGGGSLDNLSSEVWDVVHWDTIEDPTIIERFGGKPVVVRSTEGSSSVRVISQKSAKLGLQPYDIGTRLVDTALTLGHEVKVLAPAPVKGGYRQAFIIPTITRPDGINWDHDLFSSMLGNGGDTGMSMIVGLFFQKLRTRLLAGWLRPYCSNQLMDERLGLASPMSRIADLDDVTTWMTSAMGAAVMLATAKGKAAEEAPFPTPAVQWAADAFQAAGALDPITSDPDVVTIREDIEDRVGTTAGDVLAAELWQLGRAKASRPVDLVNAVTNLARPRSSWLGTETLALLAGDPEKPIVSPNVVARHQDAVVDSLMRLLFLGTSATNTSHELVAAHAFGGRR